MRDIRKEEMTKNVNKRRILLQDLPFDSSYIGNATWWHHPLVMSLTQHALIGDVIRWPHRLPIEEL